MRKPIVLCVLVLLVAGSAFGATVVLKVNSLNNSEYQDRVLRGIRSKDGIPTGSYTAERQKALEKEVLSLQDRAASQEVVNLLSSVREVKGVRILSAKMDGKDPKRMPFDFPEVLAAIAPRPVFVCAPRRDANFEISGVEDCLRAAAPVYRLLGAAGKLEAVHPDCEHSFPAAERQRAYRFFDQALGVGTS